MKALAEAVVYLQLIHYSTAAALYFQSQASLRSCAYDPHCLARYFDVLCVDDAYSVEWELALKVGPYRADP